MNKLHITAVGSSLLVAAEIRRIAAVLLQEPDAVQLRTTREMQQSEENTFYICANTQGKKLQRLLPPEQLFVFALEPTTTFFLDIAKIPAGETVYVFNNLLPYTSLLIERCRQLGITSLDFRPIAYEEMPDAAVGICLQQAKYIIGVDIFVGEQVLQSPKYQSYLRPDVKIIAGRRTASVASANRLLAGIAAFYYREYRQAIEGHDEATPARQPLVDAMQTRIQSLRRGVLQSVMSQVGSRADGAVSELEAGSRLILTGDREEDDKVLREQLQTLAYLKGKIEQLAR